MQAMGELVAVDGAYELSGHLLERQARQDQSRVGRTGEWDGRWEMAVVERASDQRRPERRCGGPPRRCAWLRCARACGCGLRTWIPRGHPATVT